MAPPLLKPGSLVASRWICGGLLAHTDGVEVYEAEEARRSRFATLKLLPAELAEGEGWPEFVALTRRLAELPGDGIARAYDLGIEAALGRPFVVSERLVFPTLARYVAERGPLPLPALAAALETFARALDAAHEAGIVHGNLKPQNLFVSYDKPTWARITDFGLAELRRAHGGRSSLLGFSAPESLGGSSSAASDRYTLALVCFFAATGSPWYSALRASEPGAAREGVPQLASERARAYGGELDPVFDAWFARALAEDPADRFPSAREMAQAFSELVTSGSAPQESEVHPFAATRPVRRQEVPSLAFMPTVPVPQAEPAAARELATVQRAPVPKAVPEGALVRRAWLALLFAAVLLVTLALGWWLT